MLACYPQESVLCACLVLPFPLQPSHTSRFWSGPFCLCSHRQGIAHRNAPRSSPFLSRPFHGSFLAAQTSCHLLVTLKIQGSTWGGPTRTRPIFPRPQPRALAEWAAALPPNVRCCSSVQPPCFRFPYQSNSRYGCCLPHTSG